jgi:hypothetical protein
VVGRAGWDDFVVEVVAGGGQGDPVGEAVEFFGGAGGVEVSPAEEIQVCWCGGDSSTRRDRVAILGGAQIAWFTAQVPRGR